MIKKIKKVKKQNKLFSKNRNKTKSNSIRKNNSSKQNPEIYLNLIKNKKRNIFSEMKFRDLKLNARLIKNLELNNCKKMTLIQEKAIPKILTGSSILACATTGTGKTFAFCVPIVHSFLEDSDKQKVLILSPTKELALQIKNQFRILDEELKVLLLTGRGKIKEQVDKLNKDPNIVVSTIGRFADLVKNYNITYKFNTLVMDEIDMILDGGFLEDIEFLLDNLKKDGVQVLAFSATINNKIKRIIEKYVSNVEYLNLCADFPTLDVEQKIVYFKDYEDKIDKLHDMLIKVREKKVLIFTNKREDVEYLFNELNNRGFKLDFLHGKRSIGRRNKALKLFSAGDLKILIATDIASRGIDIDNIDLVINYDLPSKKTDYIHRVGRTGRLSKKGEILSFLKKN